MNDLSNYSAPPGGALASSVDANILLLPLTSAGLYRGTYAAPPTLGQTSFIDVENWKTHLAAVERPLSASGAMGATRSYRTGYAYAWECDIALDFTNLIEPLLLSPWGCQIFWRVNSDGIETTPTAGVVEDKFWWNPWAKVVDMSPVADPKTKKVIRQHIVGTASAHTISLSEFSDLGDVTTQAGAYWAFLTQVFRG